MRIVAFITEGPAIRQVLGHPGIPTPPPTLKPARGPPLWQMPGSEPGDIDPRAHPVPDHEFDQRITWLLGLFLLIIIIIINGFLFWFVGSVLNGLVVEFLGRRFRRRAVQHFFVGQVEPVAWRKHT